MTRTYFEGTDTSYRHRVARKQHPACWGDCPPIQPGEVYLEATDYPGSDAGHATAAGHPVRVKVCAYHTGDRAYLLEPLPADQAHEVYLRHMRAGNG